MVTNTNTSQFVVMRDGSLDQEWLEQAVASERQEALRSLGRELVAQTLTHSLNIAKRAGRALFEATDTYLSSAN